MAQKVSSDAEKVLSGVDPNVRNQIVSQGAGDVLTSGEANRLLSAFKVSGNPYSAQNVQATTTSPTAAPDYSNPLGLRDFYMTEQGVPQAMKDVQTLTDQINKFDTSTQESLNALENQPLRMGVITGEQAATARSASTTREAIARELAAKTSFLDSARTEANTKLSLKQEELAPIRDMIMKTGGNAGITLYDSLDTAAKKAASYQKKLDKEQAKVDEKDYYKKLYVSVFGAPPKKGASTKDIQKKLAAQAKTDKATKQKMDDIEYALKKKELGKPYYAPDKVSTDSVDTTDKGLANLIEQGVNSGDDWSTIAATLAANGVGISSGSFADKYLRYKFLGEDSPIQ